MSGGSGLESGSNGIGNDHAAAADSPGTLTRAGLALLSSGFTLLLAGVAFGNAVLLLASALPLLVLVAGTHRAPAGPVIERDLSDRVLRKGERVTLDVRVTLPRGRYVLEVHQALPGAFDVADGTTLHVFTAHEREAREHAFRVVARAGQRGTFTLPAVAWERVALTGLEAPRRGTACGAVNLEVAPATDAMPRAERVRVRHGHESGGPRTVAGLAGTDFRDLREYARGDPPRAINWKATARRMSAGASGNPLVNEYEREGKRTVLVVLDASKRLDVGSSAETAFDHAVDASAGLAAFLLARGHRVGALVAGGPGGTVVVHPDTGRAHVGHVTRALARATPGEGASALAQAVERVSAFTGGASPLLIVFTRLGADGAADVERALARARHALHVPAGATRLPVVVVDVRALAVGARGDARAEEARTVLEKLDEPARAAVRRAGATVVTWDPVAEPFASAFLKEVPV